MIGKAWIAMMVGAFVMIGGLATVAAGNMNGDCLLDQDRLQLKDGSCQDDVLEDAAATDGMNGDCLQDQDRLQLKDGSCQDETLDALAMEGDCLQTKDQIRLQDGSCDQCPCDTLAAEDANYNYAYYYWSFYYSELQDGETPYMWQSQNQCSLL
jgi:hypothetical protein